MLGQFDGTDIFRWRLKVTGTNVEDPGIFKPEHHKPLQLPYVAARLTTE